MFARIVALILKELTALWKDPKTRLVLLAPPLIQVVLFSYAASFDVMHAPLGVWNEDQAAPAAELVRRFAGSPGFAVVTSIDNPADAAMAVDAKRVAAVLRVLQTFSADLLAGRTAHVELLLDGRRSNTALLIDGYANSIAQQFAQDFRPGTPAPLVLDTRDWFNPTLDPQWFILPGLVAVLSLVIAMMVSALSLARERELCTFEQMLVTPLRPAEILVGKALPAMIVGLIEANIVVLAARLWFGLPFAGSVWLLEGSLLVYMLAGVGVGLAISAFARTQQQAILGVFVFSSPAIILSGFASPVENMPASVEWLSQIDPVRYMLVISRGCFLQQMPWSVAWHSIWPMALIGAVLFGIASVAVRRALA